MIRILFRLFNNFLFAGNERPFYKDIRFWLLLIVINCGANLGFNYYFPQQTVKIFLFALCVILLCSNKYGRLSNGGKGFILSLAAILFFQFSYLSIYSFSTSIHYVLMISIAVMTVFICGKSFARYFSSIICIYAIISLVCFLLCSIGIGVPYIAITDTNIDGGIVMRVYNFYYTQLGNPAAGLTYSARNCGPFWEPGAFQGFLNLSLFFELTMKQFRDKFWKIRVIILIVTIVTTFSTGGYVVLFAILLYYFSYDKKINSVVKILFTIGCLSIFYYLYFKLDFLGQKISNDEGRLSFSFTNFPNIFYMLFGYGYSPESFKASSMESASSIFNLFRYLGIVGFFIYMFQLLLNHTPKRIIYFIIVTLILTNEPFLSNAMIWWGAAFVKYDAIDLIDYYK